MVTIVIIVLSWSVYDLYNIGFEQQKKRLEETVKSRARMIEVIAEASYESKDKFYAEDILEKVILAHERFSGFGDTGEFTLAKLHNGQIHFLLRHRHSGVDKMKPVDMKAREAEPMRRALRGEAGTLVGLDYRGKEVLAAHEPVGKLGWGIVAKIDMMEIQSPYKVSIVVAVLGAILLIGIGSGVFIRMTRPLIDEIENERRYNRMLFNESPVGLALTEMDGKLTDVNPAYAALIGHTIEEMKKMCYWEITPEKYKDEEEKQLKSLLVKSRYGPYEKEYIHADGHLVQVRLNGCLIKKDSKYYIWSSVEDISSQKRKDEELREAALVFEHTHEGIMITDASANMVRINSTFSKITGYSHEDVVGKNPRFLQSGKYGKQFYKEIFKTIKEEGFWCGELYNKHKNGKLIPCMQSISRVENEKGQLTAYVSVFSDISESKAYEEQLVNLANHDSLTSLPNRMYFTNNLEQSIRVAKRNNYKLAVLFLDLNDFKCINDQFGHEVGDKFLQAISNRLSECVREEDLVARLGGDEFVIVLNGLKGIAIATSLAQKIIDKVREPLLISENTFTPSTSIGVSIYPEHGENVEDLLSTADKAMYLAKQTGKDKYTLFTTDNHTS